MRDHIRPLRLQLSRARLRPALLAGEALRRARSRSAIFHGKRLLDVGCGFGDLLAWLRRARHRAALHRHRHLQADDRALPQALQARGARFLIGDALTFVTDEPYDYVIASGIFGYNAKDTRERVQPTLERLFDLTRIGLAVNFLSRRAPTRSPGRLYLHPADVLQFALKLTPAVRLDHTYLPNDFTLCLYRRRRGSSMKSLAERYSGKTVLAVGAHADDVELAVGGTHRAACAAPARAS